MFFSSIERNVLTVMRSGVHGSRHVWTVTGSIDACLTCRLMIGLNHYRVEMKFHELTDSTEYVERSCVFCIEFNPI